MSKIEIVKMVLGVLGIAILCGVVFVAVVVFYKLGMFILGVKFIQ